MERSYKIDIFEKLFEFLSLFYFIFGFMTTYSWACKELDKISNNNEITIFYDPVAAVYGIMNLINVTGVVICIYTNRKFGTVIDQGNKENNLLFHILCTPLFFVAIFYLSWDFVNGCMIASENVNASKMSPFMTACEMTLFVAAMLLILTVNKSRLHFENAIHTKLTSLALLATLIGVLNYFMFHMTNQQIDNFVKTASNFSTYNKFYTHENINRWNNTIHFDEVREYIQPLVILFSCCCLAYLVTLLYRASTYAQGDPDPSADIDIPQISEGDSEGPSDDSQTLLQVHSAENAPPFRLPPLSLLLGILFITITILILVIVISLTFTDPSYELQKKGQLTFSLFPILVYAISIGLLCVQINDMQRWPKLKRNKNTVDKALVWIGAAGQLIVSLAQIKLISCQFIFQENEVETFLFVSMLVLYILLLFQTLFQAVTICLALDRQWLQPEIRTWQEFICPPVGMLSINIGFFLFSVYAVKNDTSLTNFTIVPNTKLFLKIFGMGFNSLGETLAILSRLHSSLIFGKMIAYTNNKR